MGQNPDKSPHLTGEQKIQLIDSMRAANHQHPSTDHLDCHPKDHARNLHSYTTSLALAWCQAQLEPTALSVCAMLLPAACTFCPWALACS